LVIPPWLLGTCAVNEIVEIFHYKNSVFLDYLNAFTGQLDFAGKVSSDDFLC